MRRLKQLPFTPDWLFTYTSVMLLTGILVNWGAGFTQFAHSLTLPSMEVDLDISHTKAGFVITLAAMVRMGSTLISGTLAPRYGSRFIIPVGTMGAGGAMIFLGSAQTYALILLASALMGLGTGMALTPMMGLLARWFSAGDRGLAAGLAATGGSLAFIFAGVVVPWLVGRDVDDGWRHAWMTFGTLCLVIGAVSLVLLRERPRDAMGTSRAGGRPAAHSAWPMAAYKNPMIWLITFLAFTSGWSQNIFTTFFGVYLSQENGISLTTVGQLVILIGLLSVTSGVLWGRMSDKVSRGQAFFYSFMLQGIAFILMAALPGMGSFIIAAVLLGFTLRAAYTICAASSGDYVAVQFSAAAFGLMSVGAGLGSAISPTIGGAIADNFSMNWTFTFGLVSSIAGMTGSLVLLKHPRKPEALQPSSTD
jgi:MFS family permease